MGTTEIRKVTIVPGDRSQDGVGIPGVTERTVQVELHDWTHVYIRLLYRCFARLLDYFCFGGLNIQSPGTVAPFLLSESPFFTLDIDA